MRILFFVLLFATLRLSAQLPEIETVMVQVLSELEDGVPTRTPLEWHKYPDRWVLASYKDSFTVYSDGQWFQAGTAKAWMEDAIKPYSVSDREDLFMVWTRKLQDVFISPLLEMNRREAYRRLPYFGMDDWSFQVLECIRPGTEMPIDSIYARVLATQALMMTSSGMPPPELESICEDLSAITRRNPNFQGVNDRADLEAFAAGQIFNMVPESDPEDYIWQVPENRGPDRYQHFPQHPFSLELLTSAINSLPDSALVSIYEPPFLVLAIADAMEHSGRNDLQLVITKNPDNSLANQFVWWDHADAGTLFGLFARVDDMDGARAQQSIELLTEKYRFTQVTHELQESALLSFLAHEVGRNLPAHLAALVADSSRAESIRVLNIMMRHVSDLEIPVGPDDMAVIEVLFDVGAFERAGWLGVETMQHLIRENRAGSLGPEYGDFVDRLIELAEEYNQPDFIPRYKALREKLGI